MRKTQGLAASRIAPDQDGEPATAVRALGLESNPGLFRAQADALSTAPKRPGQPPLF